MVPARSNDGTPGAAEVFLRDGKAILGDRLCVSVQRAFAADWDSEGPRPPRSYARLPLMPAETGDPVAFATACPPGEVLWLGFEPVDRDRPVMLTISISGAEYAALRLRCPPDYALKGLPDGGSWRPLGPATGAGPLLCLHIRCDWTGGPEIRLVFRPFDALFGGATRGLAPPLRRSDGYGGERLP